MASFLESTPAAALPGLAAHAAASSGGRAPLWAARARVAICALFILAAVAPTLRDDYLFSDDYYWYDIEHSRPSAAVWEATMMTVMNGRPVHGALLIASLPLLAQRGGWLVLRACGVVLLWLLAWALSRALRKLWGEALAAWMATALTVLPGFALFSYWLVAMPCLVAAALGACALELALRPRPARWAYVLSVVLLVLGLSAYQPFALVYFALLGVYAASGFASRRAFALGVVAVASYYMLARLCITLFGFEIAKRGELVFAPLLKARWLLVSALPFAGKLWWIGLPSHVAWFGLCALIGWGLYSVRCARSQAARCVRRGVWVVACGAMTVLPHLAVRETVTRFRTLLPLSVLIALLLMAAMIAGARPRLRSLASGVITPSAVACLMLAQASDLWHLAVVPERALLIQAASELALLRGSRPPGAGSRCVAAEQARIVHVTELDLDVVRAGPDAIACTPRLSDDEFAAPSSQHDFAVRGILRLARELIPGSKPDSLSMESLTGHELLQPSAAGGGLRIDLRRVGAAACARASVVTPLWGHALERGNARVE